MGDGIASVSDGVAVACIFITFVFMHFIRQYDSIGDINLDIIVTIIDLL